jgi:hypothetical protein
MPLLGSAAMLLSFDVDADAIDEHDRWHTHEHLPERLSIPGFLRGTRWVATGEGPRYMVVYEVESLATLASPAYLARLNDPTPWTRRMMPHYRSMRRGLCAVLGSHGHGQGGFAALVRFTPSVANAAQTHRWLLDDALPALPKASGLGSAHLLEGAQAAAMTNEQRIRGADASVDSAVIVTGYDGEAVAGQALRAAGGLARNGASDVTFVAYRCAYSLSAADLRR